VVENVGIIEGLKRGWLVFKTNFWNMVLMGIILALISGVLGFIISLPLLLAFLPLIIPLVTSISSGSIDFGALQTTLPLSIGLCCIIYPFVLVLNGILVGYVQSAWTLTYLRLTKKPDAITTQPVIQEPLPPLPNPS
jgi:hypothetical protein